MSSSTAGFTEEQQRTEAKAPVDVGYIPTEEERRVFKECDRESFWFRSFPFSVVSMAVTHALVIKGNLSASPRFGSLPKVAFAGFFGYMAGKISYMKTCQEKFTKLESSPLGKALRERTGLSPQYSKGPDSEMSDPNTETFESMFQPAESPAGQMAPHTRDYGYAYYPDSAVQMKRSDDFSAPVTSPSVQSSLEEDVPKRKPVLYEDLRLKNRENYEVSLTQKAETLNKPTPEKVTERPKKIVKENIYGDAWDE